MELQELNSASSATSDYLEPRPGPSSSNTPIETPVVTTPMATPSTSTSADCATYLEPRPSPAKIYLDLLEEDQPGPSTPVINATCDSPSASTSADTSTYLAPRPTPARVYLDLLDDNEYDEAAPEPVYAEPDSVDRDLYDDVAPPPATRTIRTPQWTKTQMVGFGIFLTVVMIGSISLGLYVVRLFPNAASSPPPQEPQPPQGPQPGMMSTVTDDVTQTQAPQGSGSAIATPAGDATPTQSPRDPNLGTISPLSDVPRPSEITSQSQTTIPTTSTRTESSPTTLTTTTTTPTSTLPKTTTPKTTTTTTTTLLPIPVNITYNSSPSVVFGGEGGDVGQLDRPVGVDVDDQTDTIYVADYYNNRMCMFGMDGRAISCVSVFSTTRPDGSFYAPWGISVTPDRQLVVTDLHRVMVFEVTGHNLTLLQIWGTRDHNQYGSGLGEFNYPTGVAVSGRFVYAADYYNHRLQILSLDDPDNITEFRTVIPSLGSVYPYDVAIAADTGHIYVAAVDYVIVYDGRGQYLRHLAAADLSQTSVGLRAIAIDSRGQVYLGDDNYDCIHIITASGAYIQKLGKPGTCDGCFRYPYGVAVHDSSGQLIVTDLYNDNVQIFTPIT